MLALPLGNTARLGAVKKELKRLATDHNSAILYTMTDKNINTEREATDRLRSELASVLGKIMGIRTFKPLNQKEELQKVELQIHSALERHNKETLHAQFDLNEAVKLMKSGDLKEERRKEEIALAIQHGMEGR